MADENKVKVEVEDVWLYERRQGEGKSCLARGVAERIQYQT